MDASLSPNLSRRRFLKLGVGSAVLLVGAGGVASLALRSDAEPATGYQVLRGDDLIFLGALVPVVLAGCRDAQGRPPLIGDVLGAVDAGLAAVSPAVLVQLRQLFDVAASPLTRGPLTGVWSRWDAAEPEQVRAFLERWRESSLDLLRQGHNALLQMLQMAWYGLPQSWAQCGYPGPPAL